MAKILIPRSDSVSVKVIEPSDFEAFFSQDIINDYVKSGFALTTGSGLSVNIALPTSQGVRYCDCLYNIYFIYYPFLEQPNPEDIPSCPFGMPAAPKTTPVLEA